MTRGPKPSVLAVSRALYRSLLRTANSMPDDHRRALVVFRARSEFDKSKTLTRVDDIADRQREGEIYRDQLEFQAEHLQSLARSSNLLIPVDIRSSPPPPPPRSRVSNRPVSQPSRPSRPVRPTRPPRRDPLVSSSARPALSSSILAETTSSSSREGPVDRRKLIRAFQSRTQGAVRGRSGQNRFMQGPEPSWIVRKRQQQQQQQEEKEEQQQRKTQLVDERVDPSSLPREGESRGSDHRHGPECGCSGH